MKRVLITGGSGFLGARILQQGLGDAELCSLPRGFLAAAGEAEVTETIQKLQPAAIVHAAALSDTGYCAQHPEEAHRANVELPVWVAKLPAHPAQSCWRSVQIRSMPESRSPGRCRRHCPCSRPMYMAAANWKWNSACWNSARTLCCCGPAGCMTCRATGCPSGATCR